MTLLELRQLVIDWDVHSPVDEDSNATSRFESILDRLEWFGTHEWAGYLPAQHAEQSAQYMTRLADWIGNVEEDEDRKLLLEFALHLAFVSHADLCSLYRTAFSGPILSWVVEQESLALDDHDFQKRLQEELHRRTWYCPVTDSMDINEFYHVNQIVGVSHRPGFALLKMLDKAVNDEVPGTTTRLMTNLKNYINNPHPRISAPPLKRLVLLEDFVGSGTQSAGALEWAARNLDLPILFVPLVVCAPGLLKLSKLVKEYAPKLRIRPLLNLSEYDLLGPKREGFDGIPNAERIETFARATFEQVAGGPHTNPRVSPYTPFGFEDTGSYFVSYSNTPNNTMPMIHHKPTGGGWRPLFPRSARV
jgi:hypothetical protein